MVMHHAGVAVMLVCLKLEMKGLCMLKEIITICVSTEYTRDFVLGRTGNICPVIIVYHAGVAVMETMRLVRIQYVQDISAFKILKFVTECILNYFGTDEELLVKRRSISKGEHHAGLAVKAASKKEMIKVKDDSVMQKNKEEVKRVQKSNFFSCCGNVPAKFDLHKFDFSFRGIYRNLSQKST